ncbi:MAG TPA: type I secretion system permease/ATPase [Caulobacteraceae bacterium]|nr:type I secretion system permease/ATPase [Caulobacteraceae bacterium]
MSTAEAFPQPDAATQDDPVLECLSFLARRHDRPSSPVVLSAGLALTDTGKLPFHQIEAALEHVGLRAETIRRPFLRRWRPSSTPAILELKDDHAVVLLAVKDKQGLIWDPRRPDEYWADLARLEETYKGSAVLIEADPTRDRENERPWAKAARTHWFWSEVWRVRRSFMFVALAAGVINLLAFALPLFTMNVYDRIIPNKSVASLWVLALGVVLAMGLEFVLRLARGQLVDEIGRDLDAKLSQKLFEKVMNIPLLERTGSTGAFARRVSEYELVRDFFASTTVVLAVDMAFMVLFLALIAFIAPPLVLVPIVGLAIMIVAGMTLQKSMTQVSKDAQADASLQHSVLVESIGGMETLKAARAEGPMLGRWRRYAQTSAGTQEQLRRLTSVAVNMASLAQQGITIGLIVGGFYMFNAGWISMGAIIALVMLAGRALAPVGQFAFLITRARQALVTLETLQVLMDGADERALGVRSVVPTIGRGELKLEHVHFKYPGASMDSLADINLTIEPGERIGIIGRVASGKSTLGRVLCGLYPPSEGSYLVDGLDSRQYHSHELRGHFRYVGQDAELFSGTVRDNLVLGAADATDEELIAAVKRSGADMFLARDASGFDLSVGERGRALSGGQRSFLVLARALVKPAKLLFLDEPTGAMDTQSERWFIDSLGKAIAKNQTLVVSTHRHAMLNIVDRLIVIDQGRIVADGPKDKVLAGLTKAAQEKVSA